ncbi:hypothetical protein DINM_000831 [Dirofilaria immitis]|nr:hypothetical protein [Dirofilaria immitis]
MSAFAQYTFNNTNAHRICVLAEHNSYKRCGNKNSQTEFVINVPSRKIVYRRKSPVKASYVTAKPKSAPSQAEKKSECSDGKDMKRFVFAISQERRTTRSERMIRYMEEYKHEQKRITSLALSKLAKDKTTKSNKNLQSKKQRKTAGSSPEGLYHIAQPTLNQAIIEALQIVMTRIAMEMIKAMKDNSVDC